VVAYGSCVTMELVSFVFSPKASLNVKAGLRLAGRQARLAGRQARVSGLLEGRPEFDSWLGTTGRSIPLSFQAMRRWREASAKVLYECDWMIVCML
jgi:hypothetical protein